MTPPHISLTARFLCRHDRELGMRVICRSSHLEIQSHFTFIAHALHFVDGLLPIFLSQVLGLFHRLSQEFLKLSSA